MQAGAVLHPHRPRTLGGKSLSYGEVSGVLWDRRLHLLAAIRQLVHAFEPVFQSPVFLTPPAAAGRTPEPNEDLHRVASAPSRVVAWQLSALLGVQPGQSRADHAALRTLRKAADRGEGEFANRLASELETFWLRGLSRTWPAVAAHAADDIALRTRLLADHGMRAALGSLHDAVHYGNGALHLLDRDSSRQPDGHKDEVPSGGHLVLFPSPWAHTWLLTVDPHGRRPAYLIYPTSPSAASATTGGADRSLKGGLGPTRQALLADLDVPRTTTQLAARHHLSASTVSYHLALLHRTGLVTRTRTRNSVYYHQSSSSPAPAAAPPPAL
jgi:hypothetical protein